MSWLNRTHIGDCRELLVRMASEGVEVQTCVTAYKSGKGIDAEQCQRLEELRGLKQ